MRIAYFDANAGVSGDMLLGALVDAGLGLEGLRQVLIGLDLPGYRLSAQDTTRSGFRACQVEVQLDGPSPARDVAEIQALLERAALPPEVKAQAKRVFTRLGEAEARAHGRTLEEIHLHEVGAVDALVDVVGTIGGLAALGVERIVFSPLRLGYGTIDCAHGILPIPAPAVVELIKGIPVFTGEVPGEFLTPTGAALATTLAAEFGGMPVLTIGAIGLGAGRAERSIPNMLRMFLGESAGVYAENISELMLLETNLDDMIPELFEELWSRLLAAGALDVWLTPIQMKKGRPGTMLSVLAAPDGVADLKEIIFRESTTLGLRETRVVRHALARENLGVVVLECPIRVKVGRRQGAIIQVAPEYADCQAAAAKLGLPVKRVYQLAMAGAYDVLEMGR